MKKCQIKNIFGSYKWEIHTFPFQICIIKDSCGTLMLGNVFLSHAHSVKSLCTEFLASFKVWSTFCSASSFCTHVHIFIFKGNVEACELMESRGDKGIRMQVLIKRLFPQERRVENCDFNKRGKKKKRKVCQHQENNNNKKIKVQPVYLRCFQKEVFTTF